MRSFRKRRCHTRRRAELYAKIKVHRYKIHVLVLVRVGPLGAEGDDQHCRGNLFNADGDHVGVESCFYTMPKQRMKSQLWYMQYVLPVFCTRPRS
jgi:hypothetical protein